MKICCCYSRRTCCYNLSWSSFDYSGKFVNIKPRW
ncbi:MAG TPA: hypothetical protein [Caudoviricetes sp.]|nr:MAG TPA: hypothetical protein [Caudoviricetes sp.]